VVILGQLRAVIIRLLRRIGNVSRVCRISRISRICRVSRVNRVGRMSRMSKIRSIRRDMQRASIIIQRACILPGPPAHGLNPGLGIAGLWVRKLNTGVKGLEGK
jgi:hypothetical protein